MRFMRALNDRDLERLLAGHVPAGHDGQLEKVASFVRALPAALFEAPDPARTKALVAELSEAAKASPATPRPRAERRRPSRLGRALRVGIALALLPVFLAGLAVAGVT